MPSSAVAVGVPLIVRTFDWGWVMLSPSAVQGGERSLANEYESVVVPVPPVAVICWL